MKFIDKNIQFFKVLIISLGLTLIFIKYVCELLLKLAENVDYTRNEFIIGYLLIVLLLMVCYIVIFLKNVIPNTKITFLVLYIYIVYILLRFIFNDYILFIPFEGSFKYSDVIILIGPLHFLNLYFIQEKYLRIKRRDKKQSFFLEDSLFINGEIDNEKILKKLIEVISNFKPEVAFSIGINAVWGYGKSSFLHRFKDEYQNKNRNGIIFWNRIWKNRGSVAIIENFFEELKDNLRPYSGEISEDINKYVESILSLSSSDLKKIINTGKEALSGNTTLEKFYDDINENIKKIDRQIVILLDDLDRLEKPEILNTLKLIRTLSDFNNVIFIAGYDRKYIVETIDLPKDNYLDKIFNVEINLLPFDEQLIIDELLRQIDIAFPVALGETDLLGFNNAFKNLFSKKQTLTSDVTLQLFLDKNNFICTTYMLKYQDFLKTYRDVKRFINEFKFNAGFLDNEDDVIAEEYVLLKLLTYKYRDLHNEIFVSIKSIFSKGIIDDVNNIIQHFGGSNSSNVYIYDNDAKEKVNKILNKILNKYTEEDIEIINATLCFLFGKKTPKFYQLKQNSISKIYYTDIYIKNNIIGGQISITQLQSAFENSELFKIAEELSKSTEKYQLQVTNELKQFIFNNHFNTIDQFKDVMKTLNFIIIYSNYTDNQKVIDIISKGYKIFYNEDKEIFLEDLQLIMSNSQIGYLDNLFSSININIKRKESISQYNDGISSYENDVLTSKDVKSLLLAKLKKEISLNGLPNIIFLIYNLYVEIIAEDKKIVRAMEFNELVREDIKLRFSQYLESDVFKSFTERIDEDTADFEGYKPNFVLSQIFSNSETLNLLIKNPEDIDLFEKLEKEGWTNFLKFLKELDQDEKYDGIIDRERLKIMKNFITAYINNNYKALDKKQYDKIWVDSFMF